MCENFPAINDLGFLLGFTGKLMKERMDARMTQYGVTPAQNHVVNALTKNGGQATQRDLCACMRVKPSTLNGILDRMEEKGIVERSVNGSDARCREITLTRRGSELQAETQRAFQETEAMLLNGFTQEETEMLRSLLGRLIENLEEDRNKC